MTEVKFSARAFCKMILHAVKYPHCAINGVLLAKSHATTSKEIEFVDAVPLFHICLNLTPMAEIALMQIDEFASSRGLVIAGYYAANENLRDNTFEKAFNKAGEKIAANCSPAYMVVLNNTQFSSAPSLSILKVAQIVEGNFRQIDEQNISLNPAKTTLESLKTLLQEKAYNDLIDFDNHLDDISLDWMNVELNKKVEESL
ncbi:ER membrane protein complex subunit 8/9 homolog [Anthonomus grandis grandis]|uniref:ER membrane protein complex subunit 8/9 homolog n=1 Tax=Anthonomus grandis grandis TaxID=2921223 RepID=UPI002165B1B0|nr:ER membrane protein complex subunit 8/9 homolog [Anthonomus grandis grandis]